MSIQVTITVANAAALMAVAAALNNLGNGQASMTSVQPAASADTPRTAVAAPVAAPASNPAPAPAPAAPAITDFKAQLVPMLQAYSKADQAGFNGLMAKHGFKSAGDIASKDSGVWTALAAEIKATGKV